MAEDSNWGEDSLKQKLSKEITKFKGLSREEKKSYYLTYYLIPTIIIVVVLVTAGSLIYHVAFGQKTKIMTGTYINVDFDQKEAEPYLTTEFVKYFFDGEEKDKTEASMSNTYRFNLDEEGMPTSNEYRNVMALSTLMTAGGLDYMIIGEDITAYIEGQNAYADLIDIAGESFVEENKDKILYLTSPETGKEVAAGISLQGTKFATEYNLTPENSYLVFVAGSENEENDVKFLNYIME